MIALPWSDTTAPNVMLEITDECNLSCDACYVKHGSSYKSLDAIKLELKTAEKLRCLQTVTLTGGEPMLHPDLTGIIELISQAGYKTILLTNGLLASYDKLKELKHAGLNDVLFHVDTGQHRSDIPKEHTLKDIINKQDDLIKTAVKAGLDPSISVTLYDNAPEIFKQLVDSFINRPEGTMLFASHATDPLNIPQRNTTLCNNLSSYLKDIYSLRPFAYIPATGKNNSPLWYSYFVPIRSDNQCQIIYPYNGTFADIVLMKIGWLITRKFVQRMPRSQNLIKLRVFANGIASFRILTALKFILFPQKHTNFYHKMIVYDDGPYRTSKGNIIRCSFCPTAILKDDKLVRVCELQSTNGEIG